MDSRAFIVCAVLLLVPIPSPAAGDFYAGLVAYHVGDYETALGHWRPLAEGGDANAQSGIGFLFYMGLGVPADAAQAARWFLPAAEQGVPSARLFLALMHFSGDGLPKDLARAYMWCDLALASGQPDALDWRDRIAQSMTRAELEEAWRLTADWYRRHGRP